MIPTDSGPGTSATLTAQTRVLQIVVGALITGIVAFLGYVLLTGNLQKAPQGQFLSYTSVGFGALMAIMHVVVPGIIERASLANQSVGAGQQSLVGIFFTRTIIAAALLEGAAMMSVVAIMTEHQPWVLGVTGVLLVLMLMQFPSRTRVEQWLETRLMERDQGA